MPSAPHIVVVDDHREIRELVRKYLVAQGFRVGVADGGRALRRLMQTARPDLVVLDIMMPGEDGLALCREIRATSNVPIIFLTAVADETDRVVGLELGADDYMSKPFNARELVARLRAILRRVETKPSGGRVELNGIILDPGSRSVFKDGELVPTTTLEFDILESLMRSAGSVVSARPAMAASIGSRSGSPARRCCCSAPRSSTRSSGSPGKARTSPAGTSSGPTSWTPSSSGRSSASAWAPES